MKNSYMALPQTGTAWEMGLRSFVASLGVPVVLPSEVRPARTRALLRYRGSIRYRSLLIFGRFTAKWGKLVSGNATYRSKLAAATFSAVGFLTQSWNE
jgi:hypothetical protein